ncbi:uncharacterized protein METZ01_LOCUS303083, partial [marine metagenome]
YQIVFISLTFGLLFGGRVKGADHRRIGQYVRMARLRKTNCQIKS